MRMDKNNVVLAKRLKKNIEPCAHSSWVLGKALAIGNFCRVGSVHTWGCTTIFPSRDSSCPLVRPPLSSKD